MSGKGLKPSNLEVFEYIGLYGEVGRTNAEIAKALARSIFSTFDDQNCLSTQNAAH